LGAGQDGNAGGNSRPVRGHSVGIATAQLSEGVGPASPSRDKVSPGAPLARRLCSIAEASHYLAVSTWTVREMVWRGDLLHIRQGRRVLLDLRDLEAWVDRAKVRGV